MTARKRLKNQRQKGFTLIELIVVITIIGILASTVVVSVFGRSDQAMVAKVKTDFQNVKTAARLFREDHRRWPDSLDELMNPPATPNGMQMSYLENQAFDPWTGEEYYYELTDRGILLISYGADQAEGGDGFDEDIYSDDQNR
ncbi:MAG TPA: prepilin-type N-terminal cleavage/methylation domain-containing protein [Planctomycetes bacterium]|nr:prepilin-type N-terminal cleavage/methylation domain-containing protein [Planctomycetota bacterium]HIN80815.1 prepilin-type N-terminal cleavage/methylation domain-containing protein [Planctomycetota bacterium]